MNSIATNLKTLIEIGSKGFFPLFENDWCKEIPHNNEITPSKSDLKKIKKVLHKVSEYKSLERQKLLIGNLSIDDKNLFIKEFISMVEGHILDEDPNLH